jgi:hypothetical protein
MRWTLVFLLSLFGLAMALATVYAIVPSNVAQLFWLPIILISAYVIAVRAGGRFFTYRLAVGIANSFWITVIHGLFVETFMANNPQETAMLASMPLPHRPRLMMALVGPLVGVVSGAIIGILAVLAAWMFGRRAPRPNA